SLLLLSFFFYSYVDHRDLHSSPTRRSSDLWSRLLSPCPPWSGVCSFPVRRGASRCAISGLGGTTQRVRTICRRWSITAGSSWYLDRKSTRLNSSHLVISYAVFCLKKKNK